MRPALSRSKGENRYQTRKKKKLSGQVSRVFSQARESLRVLETLERETLAKARTLVRNPIRLSRRSQTQDRIAASLRSLGVASRSGCEKLERRVAMLERQIADLQASLSSDSDSRGAVIKAGARATPPSAGTFPTT